MYRNYLNFAISITVALLIFLFAIVFTQPAFADEKEDYENAVAQVEAMQRQYESVLKEVEACEDEYAKTQARIAEATDTIKKSTAALSQICKFNYKTDNGMGFIDILLSSESLTDFLHRLNYTEAVQTRTAMYVEDIKESAEYLQSVSSEQSEMALTLRVLREQEENLLNELQEKQYAAESKWKMSEIIKEVTGMPNKAALSESQVYKLLLSEGLSPKGACAVMGNIKQESGFDPEAYNVAGASYGLCQWLGGRYSNLIAFCEEHDYSYSSSYGQIKYLMHELEGYPDLLSDLQNNDGELADKVYRFVAEFERPADVSGTTYTRTGYAEAYYAEFA